MARPSRRSVVAGTVLGAVAAIAGPPLRRTVGTVLSARTERRLNGVADRGPYRIGPAARDLHERLTVVDLHADSLLWGRDLLQRVNRGHVDVPRLLEGNVTIQVFAVPTKVPRHLNIERNDDRTDDIGLVALVQGWPRATWRSLLARAEYQAGRFATMAAASGGGFVVVRAAADLESLLARRAAGEQVVGGMLAIEGAHALDGDPANVDRLADAGYRMIGLSHFFDNDIAGSAHGTSKGGLTAAGREVVGRLEARSILVDLAHASAATIDDVLAIATRPVVVSHTGVRGTADNARNLADDQLRAVAATGGIVGIGFWPTACGGDDAASIARAVAHAVGVVGPEHVGLGSDFDGAVPVPFDASGMGLLTTAMMAEGFDEATIGAVMGGSAIRFLRETLPLT
ncbi:MAG TPA: membrane dipeptidase [Candidatus Limnocylindrales bacterium]|nr:membrane dipeptidase [Candidatus Limnocylindrales bacterium]